MEEEEAKVEEEKEEEGEAKVEEDNGDRGVRGGGEGGWRG